MDLTREKQICHPLYEIEWMNDVILSPLVYSKATWRSSSYQVMPLHENIEKEGIAL